MSNRPQILVGTNEGQILNGGFRGATYRRDPWKASSSVDGDKEWYIDNVPNLCVGTSILETHTIKAPHALYTNSQSLYKNFSDAKEHNITYEESALGSALGGTITYTYSDGYFDNPEFQINGPLWYVGVGVTSQPCSEFVWNIFNTEMYADGQMAGVRGINGHTAFHSSWNATPNFFGDGIHPSYVPTQLVDTAILFQGAFPQPYMYSSMPSGRKTRYKCSSYYDGFSSYPARVYETWSPELLQYIQSAYNIKTDDPSRIFSGEVFSFSTLSDSGDCCQEYPYTSLGITPTPTSPNCLVDCGEGTADMGGLCRSGIYATAVSDEQSIGIRCTQADWILTTRECSTLSCTNTSVCTASSICYYMGPGGWTAYTSCDAQVYTYSVSQEAYVYQSSPYTATYNSVVRNCQSIQQHEVHYSVSWEVLLESPYSCAALGLKSMDGNSTHSHTVYRGGMPVYYRADTIAVHQTPTELEAVADCESYAFTPRASSRGEGWCILLYATTIGHSTYTLWAPHSLCSLGGAGDYGTIASVPNMCASAITNEPCDWTWQAYGACGPIPTDISATILEYANQGFIAGRGKKEAECLQHLDVTWMGSAFGVDIWQFSPARRPYYISGSFDGNYTFGENIVTIGSDGTLVSLGGTSYSSYYAAYMDPVLLDTN